MDGSVVIGLAVRPRAGDFYCSFTSLYVGFLPVWGFKDSVFAASSPFAVCGFAVVFSMGLIVSFRLWSCVFGSRIVWGGGLFWAHSREGVGGRGTHVYGVCCCLGVFG